MFFAKTIIFNLRIKHTITLRRHRFHSSVRKDNLSFLDSFLLKKKATNELCLRGVVVL